jgi:hypothetical protein
VHTPLHGSRGGGSAKACPSQRRIDYFKDKYLGHVDTRHGVLDGTTFTIFDLNEKKNVIMMMSMHGLLLFQVK